MTMLIISCIFVARAYQILVDNMCLITTRDPFLIKLQKHDLDIGRAQYEQLSQEIWAQLFCATQNWRHILLQRIYEHIYWNPISHWIMHPKNHFVFMMPAPVLVVLVVLVIPTLLEFSGPLGFLLLCFFDSLLLSFSVVLRFSCSLLLRLIGCLVLCMNYESQRTRKPYEPVNTSST